MPDTTSFSGPTGTSSVASPTPAPVPAAPSATADWYNVKLYGAKGDAATDDTPFIQAAIDACGKAQGGVVYFPPGTYVFKGLTAHPHQTWIGANSYSAILEYHGDMNASWIKGADMEHWTVRDLGINGTSWGVLPTGTGHAIDLTRLQNPDTHFVTFENVHVQNCGGSAFRISNPMVSVLTRCVATNCGKGFDLYGIPGGAAGTSVALTACYANACGQEGYLLSKMVYTGLYSCAADHNGVGYHLANCDGVTVQASGAELTAAKNGLDGTSLLIDNSRGVVVNSFFTWSNGADAIRVVNSSQGVSLTGCVENQPTATATASIRVQPGCSVAASGNTGLSPEIRANK